MNNLPENCIYDATTETFVPATGYTDENGNLVAPPGFSFVQAEVTPTAGALGTPMGAMGTANPCMFTPNMYSPALSVGFPVGMMNTPHMMSTPNYMGFYGEKQGYPPQMPPHQFQPRRPRFQVNTKEKLVEATYNAIKTGTLQQGIWVDTRHEDEGCHTIRVHAKKREDIALLPLIIQKIISEIGMVEFSMHYLKRANIDRKYGLTIYMRTQSSNEDTVAAIAEFTAYKIHARRVREMPEEMKKSELKAPRRKSSSRSLLMLKPVDKKKMQSLSNQRLSRSLLKVQKSTEPAVALMPADLNKFSLSSLSLKLDSSSSSDSKIKFVSQSVLKPSRSSGHKKNLQLKVKAVSPAREFPDEDPDLGDFGDEEESLSISILQPGMKKKESSRTISVLIPKKQDTIQLKFKDGSKRIVKVRESTRSKSVSKIEVDKVLQKTSKKMKKSGSY